MEFYLLLSLGSLIVCVESSLIKQRWSELQAALSSPMKHFEMLHF